MRQETDRERFRALFSELRDEDSQAAPAFDRVWRAASGRRAETPPRGLRGWGAVAAIFALAAVGGLAVLLRPTPRGAWVSTAPLVPNARAPESGSTPSANSTASLTDWRSPTEFLLELAADETSPLGTGRSSGPVPSLQNF